MKSIMSILKNRKRIKRHKLYVYSFMISLHNECEKLRLNELKSIKDKEVIQNIIFKTNLARKYRRYLKILHL